MSILAAIDFSKNARFALRVAARFARERGVPLIALHCVESADEDAFWRHLVETPWEVPGRIRQVARSRLVETLNETLDASERPEQVEHAVKLDSATDGILAAVDEYHAQMVVVGATGAGRLRQVVLGTTAERIIRHATAPVLAVSADAPERFETILAPVDLTDHSQKSLREAIDLARDEDARLLIMHAYPVTAPEMGLLDVEPDEDRISAYKAEKRRELDAFLEQFDLEEVDAERILRAETPSRAIYDVVDERDVDLICMGTHAQSGMRRIVVGSTAARVLRRMPCSVLTAPSAGRGDT